MSMLLVSLALALIAQQGQPASDALGQAEQIGAGAAIRGQISKEAAAAALANCGIRRFEASAEGVIAGKMRRTSIRLCAADSESDADWIATLEKSAAQVEAQEALPDSVKAKLLGELRAAIDQVRVSRPASAAKVAVGQASPIAVTGKLFDQAPQRSAEREPAFAALPPLPAQHVAANPQAAAPRTGPKLVIRCLASGKSSSECGEMATGTVLIVTAAETIPSGAVLRFRRPIGNSQTKIALPRGLRKGQSTRLVLPNAMCTWGSHAEFDIELIAPGSTDASTTVHRHGPFSTRC